MHEISPQLSRLAQAMLPTRWGEFEFVVFHWEDPTAHPDLGHEHVALVRGQVAGARGVPVRIHSECLTGEVFGSLRCDCKEQLETAQELIANQGIGVLLYLRQEGRGVGLTNKIRAYALQEHGADTVQANIDLHLPVDARNYAVAAAMLKALDVASVRLITNNPDKLRSMQEQGVVVDERIPDLVRANPHSAAYLHTKKTRLQHEIPSDALATGEVP